MTQLQPARGTHDFLPADAARHRHVEDVAFEVAQLYGFGEIMTPIFEFTEVFSRTLGETSDVVTKDMYTFTRADVDEKGQDQSVSLTLRPEGTAGVARAFISNGLKQSLPVKLFYRGPMFRYERPQKGRYRQFHQIGIELLGVDTPQADIEVIAAGAHILEKLNMESPVSLHLNSLGDVESRLAYRDALVSYLRAHKDALSEDSLARLERNPLRVLDSKDPGDREIVAGAPLLQDSLNETSRTFFARVCEGLQTIGIPFTHDNRLVRGLDYYCHTAFEFVSDALGAQGTVMAGGRYDGLIAQMGGPQTSGVGWAAGIERLSMLAQGSSVRKRAVSIIPMGNELLSLKTAEQLRKDGFVVDLGYSGNMGKRMTRANKQGAQAVVILGEDEVARGAATVRDLDKGTQEEIALDALSAHLRGLFGKSA